MKRFSLVIVSLLCAVTLAAPATAYAISWDWLPNILKFENIYAQLDSGHGADRPCKMHNFWGDCVIYGR